MADNLKLQNIKDLIANVKDNILGKQHAPNKILSDANDIYIYIYIWKRCISKRDNNWQIV